MRPSEKSVVKAGGEKGSEVCSCTLRTFFADNADPRALQPIAVERGFRIGSNMNTHKPNPTLKVFAIMAITLVICYICVWIKLRNNPFQYSAFQSSRERRILLLHHTDYEQLLEAGRQILKEGPKDLKNYHYLGPQHINGFPVPHSVRIPKVIRRLRPYASLINYNGYVVIQMKQGAIGFGVKIYPEGFEPPNRFFIYGHRELLPGLWYVDENYLNTLEYDKTIDSIIQKGKYPEPNQTDLNKNSK